LRVELVNVLKTDRPLPVPIPQPAQLPFLGWSEDRGRTAQRERPRV